MDNQIVDVELRSEKSFTLVQIFDLLSKADVEVVLQQKLRGYPYVPIGSRFRICSGVVQNGLIYIQLISFGRRYDPRNKWGESTFEGKADIWVEEIFDYHRFHENFAFSEVEGAS